MKVISKDELQDLTTVTGGRFAVNSMESAYNFCKQIATNHYENFPVGSILIPKKLRKNFYSVYSFARIADDIADESDDEPERRIKYLDNLKEILSDNSYNWEYFENRTSQTEASKKNDLTNPILLSLKQTLNECNIPTEPFLKLLIAFKRDVNFNHPENFNELEDYCYYSANPIGELVLRIFGLYNDTTKKYSDAICTGLQFVNFWQDLSVDLQKGRCYLPHEVLQKYSLNKENLHLRENSVNLSKCLNEIYDYTDSFFKVGWELIHHLKYFRLKIEIKATIIGGEMLLKKIRKMDSQILKTRPAHSKADFLNILLKSIL